MSRLLLFLHALCGSFIGRGQSDTIAHVFPHGYPGFQRDEITLLTGYHQGRYGFAELGIGRSIYGVMHHPYGMGYHIGAEMRADRTDICGLSTGVYVTGGVAMGVHYIHYMEGGRTMEVIRGEFGFGLFKARMTYAYNWVITRPHIEGVNTHMLTLSYAFRLARLRVNDDPTRADR